MAATKSKGSSGHDHGVRPPRRAKASGVRPKAGASEHGESTPASSEYGEVPFDGGEGAEEGASRASGVSPQAGASSVATDGSEERGVSRVSGVQPRHTPRGSWRRADAPGVLELPHVRAELVETMGPGGRALSDVRFSAGALFEATVWTRDGWKRTGLLRVAWCRAEGERWLFGFFFVDASEGPRR